VSPHVREELGAYVLGALEHHEAQHVRAHLERCAACRAAHERLAAVPPLLELVEPHPRPELPRPSPGLEAGIFDDLAYARASGTARSTPGWAQRRGLSRPLPAALGGALVGVAVTLAALVLAGAFRADPATPSIRLTGPDDSTTGQATLRPAGAGTLVDLRVRGLPPTRGGEVYEVWFARDEGRLSAGTFTVPRSGELRVKLTTAGRRDAYRRLGITREPDGLDPARNGPNVLAGELSG
jgi:anti-sigma-K factor RskA